MVAVRISKFSDNWEIGKIAAIGADFRGQSRMSLEMPGFRRPGFDGPGSIKQSLIGLI
jgi:hypothetical protein